MCTKSAFAASGPASWSSAWGAPSQRAPGWDVSTTAAGTSGSASGLGAVVLSSMIVPGTMPAASSIPTTSSMPTMSFSAPAPNVCSSNYWLKQRVNGNTDTSKGLAVRPNYDYTLTKVAGTNPNSWHLIACDASTGVATGFDLDNVTRIAAIPNRDIKFPLSPTGAPDSSTVGNGDVLLVETSDKTIHGYYNYQNGPTAIAGTLSDFITNLSDLTDRLKSRSSATWVSILIVIVVILVLIWIIWALFRRK
jgi:hypothetical protein